MDTDADGATPLLGARHLDQDGHPSDPAAEVAAASVPSTAPHGPDEPISLSRQHGYLYVSHFLSTWNSRVFEFGAVLYLAAIFPDTLLPLSVYALVRGLATVFIAPSIGQYIDTRSRLHVVRLSIVGQRFVVAGSCAIFFALSRGYVNEGWVQKLLLGVVTLFACIEKLCAVMNLVSVERDWVIVVAGGNDATLRLLNSQMRRIDLICKLAGPLFIALISGLSMDGAILFNFSMNILSVGYEYYAIAKVYMSVPELQLPKTPADSVPEGSDNRRGTLLLRIHSAIATTVADMRMYFHHTAFLPSFTCSLLYFTVLSFSGQMITYLLAVGYDARIIGFARVFSVGFELSATWLAPRVMERIGPVRSGLWFINWQILCLAVAVSVLRGTDVPLLAASALVIGTILSRLGLWGFDLSIQIIVQEEVEPERRGSFSSVEASWQSAFELCSYASTIVWSRPEQFQWPVLMSFGAVFTAGMLYASFVRKRRGHLLHMSHCMEVPDSKDIREYERLLQERHSSYQPFGMPRLAELSNRI